MKALELSKVGLPLELDVSVTPELGIKVKNRKRRECPWEFGSNCRKGQGSDTPQQNSNDWQCMQCFPIHQWVDRQHVPPCLSASAKAQTSTWTKWLAYLSRRARCQIGLLFFRDAIIIGLCWICKPSKCSCSYLCISPFKLKRQNGGSSGYSLVSWTVLAQEIHLPGWQCHPSIHWHYADETRTKHSSHRAEQRAGWLLITQNPWSLILYTSSWALLKELTLWLGQWKRRGGWLWAKLYRDKRYGKISGLTYKSLRQTLLSSMSLPIRCLHL